MIKQFLKTIPYILAFFFIWLIKDHFFFWDTVQLASRHADWFYQQFIYKSDFKLFFPNNLDSGHPPFFGLYLASTWFLFGKTLIVSHLSMLPFIFGIIFYSQKIGKILGDAQPWLLTTLLFANPFILTQCSLVSPDIVLICGFLMALFGIFQDKYELKNTFSQASKIVGLLLLSMISLRGFMLLAALFCFDFFSTYYFNSFKLKLKHYTQFSITYLPSIIVSIGFLILHYKSSGWVGYHTDSPWSPAFETVNFIGFLKNILTLIFRLFSYGNILFWLIIFYGLIVLPRQLKAQGPGAIGAHPGIQLLHLLGLLAIISVFLLPNLLLHKGLLQHRYLIPILIIATLLAHNIYLNILLKIENRFINQRSKPYLPYIFIAVLLSGNFWIFPKSGSQGWDCTMEHQPYYALHSDMLAYIYAHEIPVESIGSAFPNNHPIDAMNLQTDKRIFTEPNIGEQKYILYSNIYNQFTINDLNLLKSRYYIAYQNKSGLVEMILFEKK